MTTKISIKYSVYILRCADGSLYTGIAVDLNKRLALHRLGKAAKYTRGRGPLRLVYSEKQANHSAALRREAQIKKMSRAVKLALLK